MRVRWPLTDRHSILTKTGRGTARWTNRLARTRTLLARAPSVLDAESVHAPPDRLVQRAAGGSAILHRAVGTGTTYVFSDLTAQAIEAEPRDPGERVARALKFARVGGAWVGRRCWTHWFNVMERVLLGASLRPLAIKLFVDQVVQGPLMIGSMFCWCALANGASLPAIRAKLEEEPFSTWCASVRVWAPVQVLQQAAVPLQYRVAVSNVVPYFWDTYLSLQMMPAPAEAGLRPRSAPGGGAWRTEEALAAPVEHVPARRATHSQRGQAGEAAVDPGPGLRHSGRTEMRVVPCRLYLATAFTLEGVPRHLAHAHVGRRVEAWVVELRGDAPRLGARARGDAELLARELEIVGQDEGDEIAAVFVRLATAWGHPAGTKRHVARLQHALPWRRAAEELLLAAAPCTSAPKITYLPRVRRAQQRRRVGREDRPALLAFEEEHPTRGSQTCRRAPSSASRPARRRGSARVAVERARSSRCSKSLAK